MAKGKFSFGTRAFRNLALGISALFVLLTTTLIVVVLQADKRELLLEVNDSLSAVLTTTAEALKLWTADKNILMSQIGRDEQLVHAIQKLMAVKPTQQKLAASKELVDVREYFKSHHSQLGKAGFFIIDSNFINIGSMRDENLGIVNLIQKQRPDLIEKVFSGKVVFVPPIRSDVHIENGVKHSILPPTIFFLAPLIDAEQNIIAAVAMRLAPTKDFSRVLQLGRIGDSGETYAFDKRAKLLSESRFNKQLQRIGLLSQNEQSVLKIAIKDPGKNLLLERSTVAYLDQAPYTTMAESALRGESGKNMEGYRDYRGVNVFGVWRWDDILGIGLTTEIDVAEALNPYYMLRKMAFGVVGIVLFAAIFGIVFTLVFGERAYQVMRDTQDNLEEQISQRTSELQKSERRLNKALVSSEAAAVEKSNFLANMSHEIRTPMNAIIGFTDVLLQTKMDEMQRKHLVTVSRSSRSLLSLLDNILNISKLDKGQMELEEIVFVLQQIIDDVLATLSIKAQQKDLALKFDYDVSLPNVFIGDPTRLRQVLINLIGNAIKFTENGSVTLKIKQAEKKDFLHFMVEDTGIGIPADRLEAIFSPFSQADVSTTRKHGGTGLGTTISRQIVEHMDGQIWAESVVGEGSIFHFIVHLPEAKDSDSNGMFSEVEQTAPEPTRSLNILLAEDIRMNAELATIRLSSKGHHVTLAVNGREAVNKLHNEGPYDLILMDIQMPEMDGVAATRRIRETESEKSSHIPIIGLSASVMAEDQALCEEAGMDGFVAKPIDFNKLFAEISRVVPSAGDETKGRDAVNSAGTLNKRPTKLQPPAISFDAKEVQKLLVKLLSALHADDLDLIELQLDQLKTHLARHQLITLLEQVDDFEFRLAEETTTKLAAVLKIDLEV